MSAAAPIDDDYSANAGWLAGLLIVLAIVVVGAAVWFHYHP